VKTKVHALVKGHGQRGLLVKCFGGRGIFKNSKIANTPILVESMEYKKYKCGALLTVITEA
jgi:hypothetical protein